MIFLVVNFNNYFIGNRPAVLLIARISHQESRYINYFKNESSAIDKTFKI